MQQTCIWGKKKAKSSSTSLFSASASLETTPRARQRGRTRGSPRQPQSPATSHSQRAQCGFSATVTPFGANEEQVAVRDKTSALHQAVPRLLLQPATAAARCYRQALTKRNNGKKKQTTRAHQCLASWLHHPGTGKPPLCCQASGKIQTQAEGSRTCRFPGSEQRRSTELLVAVRTGRPQ